MNLSIKSIAMHFLLFCLLILAFFGVRNIHSKATDMRKGLNLPDLTPRQTTDTHIIRTQASKESSRIDRIIAELTNPVPELE